MQSNNSNQDEARLSLRVKVFSPSRTYFDGEAKVLSATNETGPFDILPQHHSFITLLSAGKVSVTPVGGEKQEFDIEGGLMRVRSDVATVFIGF